LAVFVRARARQSGSRGGERGWGRMATRVNRLSVRRAQTEKMPGRHADGGNLYLNVTPSGARSWVFLYKRAGRRREMGLGSVADVSLARAREIAATCRQALAQGRDPLTLKNTT
jgi:hypothetical protein